jgi:hypothetical protein
MKKALYIRRRIGQPTRQPENFQYSDKVICEICGKELKSLCSTHLSRIHNISGKEYRKKYGVSRKEMNSLTTREMRIKIGKRLHKQDIIGTLQSLVKARKANKKWRKNNPKEARRIALIGSKAGNKARKEYWSKKENRDKKSNWMKQEGARRWKDPEFRKKQTKILNNGPLVKKQKERFKINSSKRKKCVTCRGVIKPKIYIRDGYKRVRDCGKRWEEKKYCSRKCLYKTMKGRPKTEEHKKKLKEARLRYLRNREGVNKISLIN